MYEPCEQSVRRTINLCRAEHAACKTLPSCRHDVEVRCFRAGVTGAVPGTDVHHAAVGTLACSTPLHSFLPSRVKLRAVRQNSLSKGLLRACKPCHLHRVLCSAGPFCTSSVCSSQYLARLLPSTLNLDICEQGLWQTSTMPTPACRLQYNHCLPALDVEACLRRARIIPVLFGAGVHHAVLGMLHAVYSGF